MADLAADLAAFAAGVEVADLPRAALAGVRHDILDTVGCALAGARAPGIPELVAMLERWGGAGASVWGRHSELSPPDAALANGSAAHALDYDDTHDEAVLHAGVTAIPAALAAAQMREGATGADVVAAAAAGVEIACRLGASLTDGPSDSGWLLTPLCGTFGAAAAAARALGLDAATTRHALGIAYAQAAGNGQATLDAALTKRLQAGLAARAGVFSAALAAAGITGASDVFEGARGWFPVYHRSRYDRDIVLGGLGSDFLLEGLRFKPYPCCRWMHAAIQAALEVRARGVAVADIAAVSVAVSSQALASTGRRPSGRGGAAGVVEAQFSIPFGVAVALLDGVPRLRHFTPEGVDRADVLGLAELVTASVDADLERATKRGISSAELRVELRDGGALTVTVDEPAPLRSTEITAKFRDACEFAGLDAADADAIAGRLLTADLEPDADRLVRSLRCAVAMA